MKEKSEDKVIYIKLISDVNGVTLYMKYDEVTCGPLSDYVIATEEEITKIKTKTKEV